MDMNNLKLISLFIFLFLIGCSSSNSSSAYERFLECQLKALDSHESRLNNCKPIKTSYEAYICYSKVYKEYALDVCSTDMAVSLNSVSELYKLMALLYDSTNNKIYSQYQRQTYSKELLEMISSEIKYANSTLRKEIDVRESAFNQARANSYITNALTILGAQLNSGNNASTSSPFKTYILNGKMISCMTTGNITTCN